MEPGTTSVRGFLGRGAKAPVAGARRPPFVPMWPLQTVSGNIVQLTSDPESEHLPEHCCGTTISWFDKDGAPAKVTTSAQDTETTGDRMLLNACAALGGSIWVMYVDLCDRRCSSSTGRSTSRSRSRSRSRYRSSRRSRSFSRRRNRGPSSSRRCRRRRRSSGSGRGRGSKGGPRAGLRWALGRPKVGLG